jgi:hypothetical protein
MQWFGKSWGAHVCEGEHVPTPVGAICFGSCGEPIAEGDRGVVLPYLRYEGSFEGNDPPNAAYHLPCFLRSVFGDKWRPELLDEKPSDDCDPTLELERHRVGQ